jgi:threonine efflux protein
VKHSAAMDLGTSLLTVTAVWAAVVVSPGPDFVVTAHHASARSRRSAFAVVAGIATATFVWAAGTMAGLAVLFARAGWLIHGIRLAGAAYLIWLGARMIWSTRRRKESVASAGEAMPAAADRSRAGGGALAAFRAGFLTDLANPKAAVFWSGLLSLVLPPHPTFVVRLAVVGVAVGVAAGWYAGVAVLFSTGHIARAHRRMRRWIDRLTGAVMVGLGVRLGMSA